MRDLIPNWLDSGRAKQAVTAAFVAAYPQETPILTPYQSDDRWYLFMAFHEPPTVSWWAVDRETFTAMEVPPPLGWPNGPSPPATQ